jgi:septum formation protein
MTQKKNIILASTSHIRKEMLKSSGLEFKTEKPLCDEDELKKHLKDIELIDLALELAKAKAYSVSKYNENSYVIGSDQVCELKGEIIDKSKNYDEAFSCLKKLQGKTHKQNNGTCVYLNGECVLEVKDYAELKMKPLTDKEIKDYIEKDMPIGCAGSYKYEQNGATLFEEIKGTEECIKGFNLSEVLDFLKSK